MGNINSFSQEFGILLVGSILFTASFIWKDLVSDIQETLLPKKYSSIWQRTLYTIIVTIILIYTAIHLRNFFGLNSNNNANNNINSDIRGQLDDSPIDDNEPGNNFDIAEN